MSGRFKPENWGSLILAVCIVALVVSPIVHLGIQALSQPDVLRAVLLEPGTRQLLWRSLILAAAVGITSMALGTFLAWLTTRVAWPRWWRMTLTVLLCAALAVPSYVAAFGLIAATGAAGFLAPLLPDGFHVRDHPLLSSWLVLVCCTYPYVLLSVRSAMLRECATLEEAALGLGASRLRAFITIALPRLMPNLIWGGMLVALYTLSDFGAVSLLGYETLTWGIYSRYDTAFGLDEARALALVLAAITLLLIALMRFVRPELIRATSNVPVPAMQVRLGLWSLPAYLLIALPVFIGVALPVISATYWLVRGGEIAASMQGIAAPAASTMMIALAAAVLVPLLALPIASVHLTNSASTGDGRGRMWTLLSPLTLIGFALPGIVVAIASIGLALRFDQFIEWMLDLPVQNRLYQSHMLLLLAYTVLFLPEAVGPLRSNAAKIHPEQLDAAEQFGTSAWTNWRKIVLPQMTPALAAGAALVFVTTAKELPATLLMAPPGFQTLATRLWGAMTEAYFAQAAAATLMLLAIATLGLVVILLIERIGR